MQTPPNPYEKPGARSSAGSGLDTSALGKEKMTLGSLTPAGLVSYPTGAPEVTYYNGADTPARAAYPVEQIRSTPYKAG